MAFKNCLSKKYPPIEKKENTFSKVSFFIFLILLFGVIFEKYVSLCVTDSLKIFPVGMFISTFAVTKKTKCHKRIHRDANPLDTSFLWFINKIFDIICSIVVSFVSFFGHHIFWGEFRLDSSLEVGMNSRWSTGTWHSKTVKLSLASR